jgi:hypothetical protein
MTRSSEIPRLPLVFGISIGAGYGILARAVAQVSAIGTIFGVMTLAFLFIVPIAIGYLTVAPIERPSLAYSIFAPWIPSIVTVLAAALLGWEGAICIVLALPVLLILSSIGGLIARHAPKDYRRAGMPLLMIAPYALAPVEHMRSTPTRLETTETSIVIDAPPSVVWPLVVSVDSIRAGEEKPALFTTLGFPHPVSAIIDHPGVGGTRIARFTGGLVFTEHVSRWDPERFISFTIRPNTESIPAATLDPHVTIGGPYFDVLTGTYELRWRDKSSTLLILRSEHRVSTPFNMYAGWWSNRIMRSIQENILQVIRTRAERSKRTMRTA